MASHSKDEGSFSARENDGEMGLPYSEMGSPSWDDETWQSLVKEMRRMDGLISGRLPVDLRRVARGGENVKLIQELVPPQGVIASLPSHLDEWLSNEISSYVKRHKSILRSDVVLEALWQNYFLPAGRHGFGLASVGKEANVTYTDGLDFIMYKHIVQTLGIITPLTTLEMGVLNHLGVEPLVNVFFTFYKPIGKGDKWVNFQTRGKHGIILADLAKGRGYPENKTIMQRKKAREMPSQEHWEESVRGRPEAGEEEATNQSTLCEGWSLMGIKFDPKAKYNRLKVVVKQMKNKTCKMVSNREQLTIDLDATVIRSKKFELERDSTLTECKKLELKRDAALIDSKQLELKREIDQLEFKQLKTDIVDMGREVVELKEQIMATINFGWSNCLMGRFPQGTRMLMVSFPLNVISLKTWAKASVVENEGVEVTNRNEADPLYLVDHYIVWVVAWGKLTKPKSSGGMGFKCFFIFNLALVAKHTCRVLNNPNELWVKVLKGLHFQIRSSFKLARGLGFVAVVRPWSGCLEGLEILRKELSCRFGNGNKFQRK
ncbi:reverse transcriptase [Senna tora]|uniref:Reverse transcriptase n=1 Tax=Senna tora TaxID=362788 RepID=A0A834W8E5_9FABA|nr:reverse transcriptase [Senna tora]